MRNLLVILGCAALSACSGATGQPLFGNATFGGPALISGQSPPNAISNNSEPQPVNSLPRGAEGVGPRGPNSRFPNYGSFTTGSPI